MDSEIERLANKALADLQNQNGNDRVIIGIAGVPGSGKTTIASAVALKINQLCSNASQDKSDIAVVVPMDGFHYSRKHLASMPNPEEAIHRRGAAFTFDADGFLALIQSLRKNTDTIVYAPSFGHEIKDPVPDSITIAPESRIVLVEGNYCALDRTPWKDAAALMTRLWYIDTPSEVTIARLAKRHLESGIVADEKEAWERASGTDEVNAKDIRDHLLPVDEQIKSH